MARIQEGEQAPDFKMKTTAGLSFVLSEMRGRKVWLSFYRYARCPLCSVIFNAIVTKAKFLKKHKIELVAVFESSLKNFPSHIGECSPLTCAIIPDPEKTLYKLYGIEKSVFALFHPKAITLFFKSMSQGYFQGFPDASLNRLPAHFLIDESGKVHKAYYGEHAADHITWETVEEFAG